MKLRKLEIKDAPLMLEWMHDRDVTEKLRNDFSSRSLKDCESFIDSASVFGKDVHLAVTDDNDEYMGTVSLKDIDEGDKTAEFAIVVRKCAMGTGVASEAMKEMIRFGFDELGLSRIIWCVDKDNLRAVRFYDKNGYKLCTDVPARYYDDYADFEGSLLWYEA